MLTEMVRLETCDATTERGSNQNAAATKRGSKQNAAATEKGSRQNVLCSIRRQTLLGNTMPASDVFFMI